MEPDLQTAADRFAAVARDYCAVIEALESLDFDELFRRLFPILSRLLYEGCNIPFASPTSEDLVSSRRTREEFFALFSSLQDTLGPAALFYEYYDPWDDKDHGVSMLADDLADIYFDMKDGLLALEAGAPTENVLFEWRLGFQTHWGLHIVDALRAIHYRLWS